MHATLTEILVTGAKADREKLSDHLKSFALNTKEHLKNVTIVSCHLSNVAKVRPFLSQANTEKLMHAFISSRLDYCNILLTDVSKKSISQLQLVQKAAARVLK